MYMEFRKKNLIFHMRWISFEDFIIMIFYMMFWCYTFFQNPLPHQSSAPPRGPDGD